MCASLTFLASDESTTSSPFIIDDVVIIRSHKLDNRLQSLTVALLHGIRKGKSAAAHLDNSILTVHTKLVVAV